jgi:hypothetical protein
VVFVLATGVPHQSVLACARTSARVVPHPPAPRGGGNTSGMAKLRSSLNPKRINTNSARVTRVTCIGPRIAFSVEEGQATQGHHGALAALGPCQALMGGCSHALQRGWRSMVMV